MESPQVTTDTASSPQPERQWVWRATLESRAAGKVSVLACVETVFAVALYWWIAIRWDTHWHLVTSVFIAPLLLLRSPESIAAGVRWFLKDWWGYGHFQSWTALRRRAWTTLVIVFAASLAFTSAWGFSTLLVLIQRQTSSLYFYASIGGVISSAVTFAVVFASVFAGARGVATTIAVLIASIVSLSVSSTFAFSVISRGTSMAAIVAFFSLAGSLLVVCGITITGASGVKREGVLLRMFAGLGAGVAVRAIMVRIYATCRFAVKGIRCLPSNFRENNLLTDTRIPAELLPGIRDRAGNFSFDGWFQLFRAQRGVRRFFVLFVAPTLFLPAFLYRLNIKATAWFWWPLAFLLRPVKQPTVAEDQKEVLCWPWTNPFQKLLFVGISLLAMAVLFARHVDPVRWSRLSKVEGVWTPVKALLALDWSHFPPWHWAIFVSAACGIGMLALAGGAVSCAANQKWPPPGLGWKVKAMKSLVRVRTLATVALLLFSLGALFIAHTPWHAHVPLPASWYSAMKKFYRVKGSAEDDVILNQMPTDYNSATPSSPPKPTSPP